MSRVKCDKDNSKKKAEMHSENQENTSILISDQNGQCTMTTHQVFPGITFVYNDAHIQSVQLEERKKTSKDIIEIRHCREGRLECNIHDEFYYLASGDMLIVETSSISSSYYFPLRHYHGLTIQMDLNKTPQCLSCLLDDVIVQPKAIAEKFCGKKGGFIVRGNPSFEHIFSELYSVPAIIQKGYFKIKTLELFLYLSALDIQKDEIIERTYTKMQVELAKEVSRYLMENMDVRITLEQLAERFHISGTHIKNTFKGVFGVSLGAYTRAQKMESAAYMLEYTDKSILDIANEHGYDNGSKFASAFRAVKGIAPNEYRNQNSKIRI